MTRASHTTSTELVNVGIDIGKDIFHLVGFDAAGSIVLGRKIKRLALAGTFEKLPRLKIRAFLIEQGITVRTAPSRSAIRSFPSLRTGRMRSRRAQRI